MKKLITGIFTVTASGISFAGLEQGLDPNSMNILPEPSTIVFCLISALFLAFLKFKRI